MVARNTKKLDTINSKIANLQKTKNQLEDNFVQYMSQQIAKIFVKKKVYDIDQSVLFRKIESLIDEIYYDV